MRYEVSDIPSSVYRIQLSETFPLKKVISLLKYLFELGVEGIYLSPLFDAFTPNGYDVEDPNALNPLLGTGKEFEELCASLKNYKMKHILDVVPNHMGIKGKKNKWWLDVLKEGPKSAFAPFFDIDWKPEKEELRNKILLPILKEPYGSVLEEGAIKLKLDNGYWIVYADYQLPVSSAGVVFINDKGFENFEGKKGDPKSFDLLHQLLEKQWYRLSHWLVAGQEINYRRFFNINELIGIHIENETVLKTHHKWVFDLLKDKKVQGVRVDHPDGLYDPTSYFERLAEYAPLIIAEKVLDFKESLHEKWRVDGTVGYDFLNVLNGVFVDQKNEKALTRIYERFIGFELDYETLLYDRKKRYTTFHMGNEINRLGKELDHISEKNRNTRDFTKIDLSRAIQEVTACFPVYRTYVKPGEEVRKKDAAYINQAIVSAKKRAPEIDASVFDYLKDILLLKRGSDEDINDFVLRFQQMTAPAMAKGLEDSLYYIYNRLLSLNEVGNHPKQFGVSRQEFHDFNIDKQRHYPLGFLATSTHDTKRSQDVRVRLDVLTEIPDKWRALVFSWKKENKKFKKTLQKVLIPDANTEYYIYQMLLGMWLELPPDLERIWECLLKSLREAGLYTNWRHINEDYENGVKEFLYAILDEGTFFYSSFIPFQNEIARYGRLNSLSQLVLKMGACGIVDLYQGNEVYTYRLMDPDNRKDIDFDPLQKLLRETKNASYVDEEGKFFVTKNSLQARKAHKNLFLFGDYIPLTLQGEKKEHVVAFARMYEKQTAIIAASRFFTKLPDTPIGSTAWEETEIVLPQKLSSLDLTDIFTKKKINSQKKGKKNVIKLKDLFSENPFAIGIGVINS